MSQRFLSKDRASLMSEEEKYLYRSKNTIYETEDMKASRLNSVNEGMGDAAGFIREEIPPDADIFKWFFAVLKKLLGLLGLALAGAAALIAKAIMIRTLKNAMLKLVDWTEYGWHGKRGKGIGEFGRKGLGRWVKAEADKDRESYFSHEYSSEREVLRITQQLMKSSGLINLQ